METLVGMVLTEPYYFVNTMKILRPVLHEAFEIFKRGLKGS